MFCDVHSSVFGLGLDTEQVEVVEGVKDEETPNGCPKSNTDPTSNIDTEEIPRSSCMALKFFCKYSDTCLK